MTIKDQLNYNKNVVRVKEDADIVRQAAVDEKDNVVAYLLDGAINPLAGVAKLNKVSAGAYTLAAPADNEDGKSLYLISDSAFAHVVTATDLIEDGVTGGPKDTMTFAAFKGAAIHLKALNAKWYVVAKNLVTIAGA